MMRRIMLRVIGPAVLYSVFGYKQKENGMPAKIMVSRTDHTPQELRELASKHKFRDCRHRLRAIALAIEGGLTRTEIAGDAGVDAQTLCDWVKRYNEEGLEGLRDNARPGRPSLLDVERRAAVTTWLAAGPDPDAGEPSRWTVADIRERIMDSFGVRYTLEGVRRLIRRLGFRHVSPDRSIPGRSPRPRRNSGTVSRGWRRRPFPTACPLQTSSCISRTRPASARKGCFPGSGRGRARARASCRTIATDTSTCSPLPAPRPGPQSGMYAQEPTPER